LDCSKKHKIEANCDGKRKILHYIPLDKFTDANIQDGKYHPLLKRITMLLDYQFLDNVTKTVDNAKRQKLSHNNGRGENKLSYSLKQLVHQATKKNISLQIMPTGMSKRKANTTFFDTR
jgi:hypothetical protein